MIHYNHSSRMIMVRIMTHCVLTKDLSPSLDPLHRTCLVREREVIKELIHPLRSGDTVREQQRGWC